MDKLVLWLLRNSNLLSISFMYSLHHYTISNEGEICSLGTPNGKLLTINNVNSGEISTEFYYKSSITQAFFEWSYFLFSMHFIGPFLLFVFFVDCFL